MGHSSHDSRPLGINDVIGGAIIFVLITWGLYSLLDAAVPGLFKFTTMIQVLISGLLFLLVWGLFGGAVFKAYFDVLEERESKTLGAENEAGAMRSKAREIEKEIAIELRTTRLEGLRARDELIEEAKKQSTLIKDAATEKADKEYKTNARELARLREEAKGELGVEAEKLSQLVKERALASDSSRLIH
jgi:F0F1-type ATP synthase membrane subunit b/b'